jgi:hypothetical protein
MPIAWSLKLHVWGLKFQDMDRGIQKSFVVISFSFPLAMATREAFYSQQKRHLHLERRYPTTLFP